MGFAQDIAERWQAEEALRASEARFRQVVASIPEHIYVWEIRGEGQMVNIYHSSRVEELTGYPCQGFMDDWMFWLETAIQPADREAAQAQVARLLAGQASVAEYRLLRSDGRGSGCAIAPAWKPIWRASQRFMA
jgi:PAS domain S-box-containing protein